MDIDPLRIDAQPGSDAPMCQCRGCSAYAKGMVKARTEAGDITVWLCGEHRDEAIGKVDIGICPPPKSP